ncbi:hypothetical protein BBP40_007355 [Aspergillus hancockii]|nr:hypothetical protein BBP40_007355 [Aspergillus hancockii]
MEDGNKELNAEPLSQREKNLFAKYGRLPRGAPLGQQPRKRTYFDSGDFALSATGRVTDDGAIRTGVAHPLRESISRPYAAVPSSSNVQKDANNGHQVKESPSPEINESIPSPQTNIGNESSGKEQEDDYDRDRKAGKQQMGA